MTPARICPATTERLSLANKTLKMSANMARIARSNRNDAWELVVEGDGDDKDAKKLAIGSIV